MGRVVELIKGTSTKGDIFDRGERVIMVDGVRWGRTVVNHHGSNGTSHSFVQENGSEVLENPDAKYIRNLCVRSSGKRRRWSNDPWRPTEELVLEKAKELVETGRLRDPKIVARENEEARARWRQEIAEAEAQKKAAFDAKAREALGINSTEQSDVVDRVIAAMEWAQTQ